MKNITLLLFTFSVPFIVKSQTATPPVPKTNDQRSLLTLSYGVALPMGAYGSDDVNNPDAGLAKTGHLFNLFYGIKLGSNLGISLLLQSQSNDFDAQLFENALAANTHPFSWTVTANNYRLNSFMFGGYGSFPLDITNLASFQTRAMIGYASVRSPEIKSFGSDVNTGFISQTISSVSGDSFSFLIGIGFRFTIESRVSFIANVDYFHSEPQFENISVHTESTNYNSGYSSNQNNTITFQQPVSSINISGGLAVSF
jgi:hypothetical protein